MGRTLTVDDGETVPLWLRSSLPSEAAEFSVHFRQLIGWTRKDNALDPNASPTQRLCLHPKARAFLFQGARLWAYLGNGDFAKVG